MHIIIYESSSHGGCFKYAIELFRAYSRQPEVVSIELFLPINADFEGEGVKRVLLDDNIGGNKLHFLWRHFLNPLKFLFHIIAHKNRLQKKFNAKQQIFVLLNDFEQLSAPIWAPLYRLFLKDIIFGVFIHDSDRDSYPPTPLISAWCMKQMMKAMNIALYHGTLPKRSYYKQNGATNYLQVEHGLYQPAPADKNLIEEISAWKNRVQGMILTIPGNIRFEKNYEIAIKALQKAPNMGLIIAGNPANISVSTQNLRTLSKRLEIENRVFWIERYLSDEEMTSVIMSADIILLYYSSSFHAQSGMLNQIAPLRKPVITGKLQNALTQTVERFNLGWIIEPDSEKELVNCLQSLCFSDINPNWDAYFDSADWNRQARKVIAAIKNPNNQ